MVKPIEWYAIRVRAIGEDGLLYNNLQPHQVYWSDDPKWNEIELMKLSVLITRMTKDMERFPVRRSDLHWEGQPFEPLWKEEDE